MSQITLPTRIEDVECVTYLEHPYSKTVTAIAKDGRCFMLNRGYSPNWFMLNERLSRAFIKCCENGFVGNGRFRIKVRHYDTYNFAWIGG